MTISSATMDELTPASKSIGKKVYETLCKHYPVFRNFWMVTVNQPGGTISVTNSALSGTMGFMLHTTKIDPEGKAVMRAGGELLERYSVLRYPSLSIGQALKNTYFDTLGRMRYAKD